MFTKAVQCTRQGGIQYNTGRERKGAGRLMEARWQKWGPELMINRATSSQCLGGGGEEGREGVGGFRAASPSLLSGRGLGTK